MARLVLVCAAGVLGIAVVVPMTVAKPPGAGVRIVNKDPLTLSGHDFKADERVRLVVTLRSTTRVRKLRADPSGSFDAEFEGLRLKRCGADLEVTAVGKRGSHVAFTLRTLDCAERGPARPDSGR